MNKKGFTLIELIAVIVIMGMLLMIVIPATGRLIASNDKQVYDQYYNLVREATYKYARGESFDLGGVSNSGCKNVDTLDEYVDLGLIKPFSVNEDNVECYLPGELNEYTSVPNSAITNLQDGHPASDFVNIRIRNDKGNLKIENSLVCVRDDTTIVYKHLVLDDKVECKKFVPTQVNVLYSYITDDAHSTSIFGSAVGNTRFVSNGTKNYVRYSGKMWRIVSVNTSERTIKLVSDEVVGYYNFDETTSSKYKDSNIEGWINSVFKPTLRIPNVYLQDAAWSFTQLANGTNPPAANQATEVQSTVGLLNLYEFEKTKGKIGSPTSTWFTISPKDGTKIWNISGTTATEAATNVPSGIRPAIVLRPGVTFISGGVGTADNPFEIIGEQSGLTGEKLNTRFAGEYVKFSGKIYRIISTGAQGTRMTTSEYSLQKWFDNSNMYIFGPSTTSGQEVQNIYEHLTDKAMVDEQEYCTSFYAGNNQFQSNCPNSDKRTGFFSLPRVGEMYTVPQTGNYWTISPREANTDPISGEIKDPKMNMMTSGGLVSSHIRTDNCSVYPVFVINSNVKIKSGSGKLNDPYLLEM